MVYYAVTGGASALPQILLIALFIALFYLFLLRPMKRRQQQAAAAAAQMRSQLSVGDEIVTIGGLMATVVSTDDDSVTLELSPGVTARYDRAAIARIVTPDESSDDSEDDDSETDLEATANSIVDKKD